MVPRQLLVGCIGMTDYMDGICSNCSSSEHAKCCPRCGTVLKARRLSAGLDYCTAKCEQTQIREDKLSFSIENGEQAARLNAATARGLNAIRSLAAVTAENGIDMTGAECSEMRLAIQWLDKHLGAKGRRS